MSLLKLGVVGVGALGRHHARILSEMDGVELTAVAETNPELGKTASENLNTEWVDNYQDLIGKVDAVSIVVPTQFHHAVATEFLNHQVPVMVEKPLAGNLKDARGIVEAAEANSTLLQVGHIERFNPATQSAWKLTGPPKYIRSERVSPYSFRSIDIGVVHDLMIHDIDLILDLVKSPVKNVEAFGLSVMGENEDNAQARLTFENGCLADLTASRINPTAHRTMMIWSLDSAVQVDFNSREVVSYRPTEKLLYGTPPLDRFRSGVDVNELKEEVFGSYLKVETNEPSKQDALTAELQSFVDCVEKGEKPLAGGAEALAAMEVADRVLNCIALHEWNGNAAGPVGPFAEIRVSDQKQAG